jgi:hypothetical protein
MNTSFWSTIGTNKKGREYILNPSKARTSIKEATTINMCLLKERQAF